MYTSFDGIPPSCLRLRRLAERAPRHAVVLARRWLKASLAETPSDHAWLVSTLGWALLWWERFDEARDHLASARAMFRSQGQTLALLHCEFGLLLADLYQYADPTLTQRLAGLATEFEEAGAAIEATHVLLHQAFLLNVLKRPRDAEAVLVRLSTSVSRAEPIDQARWLYICGAVAISSGDYDRAEDLLGRAKQVFADLHAPLEYAKCCFQQAWAALSHEHLILAMARYQRAEQLFTRLDLPLRLALCSKGQGFLLTRMGLYDDALRALLHALQLFNSMQRTDQVAACHLNIGNVFYYTGQWAIALGYYERAEELYISREVVSERLTARRNRAMVYRAQGRRAAAYELLIDVEAQAQANGDQVIVAESWADLAAISADEGQFTDAMAQYQRAKDLFTRFDNMLGAADCAMEQGWLALQQDDIAGARQRFQFAAPLVVHHPYDRWRTEYGLACCAETVGDVDAALDHYRAAIMTVAELRRKLASEVISSSLYRQAAQLHADALALAIAHGTAVDLLKFSEWQRALVLQHALVMRPTLSPALEYQQDLQSLQSKINTLIEADEVAATLNTEQIDTVFAQYSAVLVQAKYSISAPLTALDTVSQMAFDVMQLRTQLDQLYGLNWTVLVYTLSKNTLSIGVLGSDKLEVVSTPYDRALQRMIDRATQLNYRRYIYHDLAFHGGDTEEPWLGLRELAERIIPQQALERLTPSHRLLVVPFGSLHLLPWGALRIGTRWLAELAIVHMMPSLTVCQALSARRARHLSRALLVGCSTFDAWTTSLPAVTQELTAVAARWPGECVRLDDSQATRTALLEKSGNSELRHYGLLHIASHAQLLPERGLAAHIKLWDGDLWLSEIATMHLDGALVTLSSCEGAMADTLPGEEILSLSWAFLAAGAGGVIASLWVVNDRDALEFMKLFYTALKRCGDPGEALAHAQRMLIERAQSGDDPLSEPISWGSFVLTGGCHALW